MVDEHEEYLRDYAAQPGDGELRRRGPPQDDEMLQPLAQHHFTASEADVKMLEIRRGGVGQPIKHRPVSIHQHHAVSPPGKPTGPPLRRVLDGFHLLTGAGAILPADARQAVFVDKGLVEVVEEDLPHFTNMISLDVSENNLQMHMFAGLPRLKLLNMACNSIQAIEADAFGRFHTLTALDMSYNSLTLRSVQNLDYLPSLKELDLCGNNLCGLPMEMYRFIKLEKLMLDNNKMDDNGIFNLLCTMPNLRQCSLAYNFLHKIPEQCCGEGYFPLLTQLDISFNYFGTEEDVQPIVELPRMLELLLYGNPMLGPKGEDPLYTYIEDLEIAATDGRLERRMHKIDLITEIPRKRNFKKLKGRAAGRQASYRDFGIVAVGEENEGAPVKTTNEWREEGNRTLFADAIALAQKEKLLATIPDNTFITMSAGDNDADEKILKLADKVMDHVAKDLDLTTSAEILYFQDRTNLKTKNFNNLTDKEIRLGQSINNPPPPKSPWREGDDEPDEEWKYDNEEDDDLRDINTPSYLKQPIEKVPPGMFSRTMADPSTLQTHPVAVKTAMRALQFAIKHPLTNYDEVPAKGGLPPKDYVRETKASINRKMPKQESSIKPLSDIGQVKNKSMRGLGEPSVVAVARKKGHNETLVQIEAVLDKLNRNADEIAMKGSGTANTKDGINTMKNFARPQTGLRGLVKMVDEVVADLDR